jgi:hypothetical protein
MTDYAGHYRLIESGLNRLLANEQGILSSAEVTEIREFLDAREYGLALETLAAILDEGKELSRVKLEEIQNLAERMHIAHEAPIAGLLTRLAPEPQP